MCTCMLLSVSARAALITLMILKVQSAVRGPERCVGGENGQEVGGVFPFLLRCIMEQSCRKKSLAQLADH